MNNNNLLVIMSDEHQSRAMGCADHPFVQTPHLDKLAIQGTRFTQAYTPSPICVPARAAFASGRYVHSNRLWDNAMPYTGAIPGWGHALQNAGVSVESIGKLHYRDVADPAGFDHEHIPMMVVDGVGMVWASIRGEDERISPNTRMLGEKIGAGESKYTEYDAKVTQRAIEWLHEKEANAKPWCLFVGFVAPHFPLVVPQQFYDLYPTDALPEVKLHPSTGYQRHPWVEKQNALMDSESTFKNTEERLSAMASYFGLCSWLDHNIGQVLNALNTSSHANNTTVIYTSDHGDNVGARGLWGKSNMYEESCAIPLIASGPDYAPGAVCDTPVSLLDLSVSIATHFNTKIESCEQAGIAVGDDLARLSKAPTDADRIVFSEYHAAGAVTGAFMIRRGRWKFIHYVGFEPELFDLEQDPEELHNLANDRRYHNELALLKADLLAICDPDEIEQLAHSDQQELIEKHGGKTAALKLGAPGATPPPT